LRQGARADKSQGGETGDQDDGTSFGEITIKNFDLTSSSDRLLSLSRLLSSAPWMYTIDSSGGQALASRARFKTRNLPPPFSSSFRLPPHSPRSRPVHQFSPYRIVFSITTFLCPAPHFPFIHVFRWNVRNPPKTSCSNISLSFASFSCPSQSSQRHDSIECCEGEQIGFNEENHIRKRDHLVVFCKVKFSSFTRSSHLARRSLHGRKIAVPNTIFRESPFDFHQLFQRSSPRLFTTGSKISLSREL